MQSEDVEKELQAMLGFSVMASKLQSGSSLRPAVAVDLAESAPAEDDSDFVEDSPLDSGVLWDNLESLGVFFDELTESLTEERDQVKTTYAMAQEAASRCDQHLLSLNQILERVVAVSASFKEVLQLAGREGVEEAEALEVGYEEDAAPEELEQELEVPEMEVEEPLQAELPVQDSFAARPRGLRVRPSVEQNGDPPSNTRMIADFSAVDSD